MQCCSPDKKFLELEGFKFFYLKSLGLLVSKNYTRN